MQLLISGYERIWSMLGNLVLFLRSLFFSFVSLRKLTGQDLQSRTQLWKLVNLTVKLHPSPLQHTKDAFPPKEDVSIKHRVKGDGKDSIYRLLCLAPFTFVPAVSSNGRFKIAFSENVKRQIRAYVFLKK